MLATVRRHCKFSHRTGTGSVGATDLGSFNLSPTNTDCLVFLEHRGHRITISAPAPEWGTSMQL